MGLVACTACHAHIDVTCVTRPHVRCRCGATIANRVPEPLDLAAVVAAVASGRIAATTLVWSPGLGQWTPASSVPALAPLFPPPLPQATT